MATSRPVRPFDGDPTTELDRRVERAAELARERNQTHFVYVNEGLVYIGRHPPADRVYIKVPPNDRAVYVFLTKRPSEKEERDG